MAKQFILKNQEEESYGCYLCTLQCCGCCCGQMAAWIPCCCCITNPYQRVSESFIGVIERFGKFQRFVSPGLHYINPCTEKLRQVEAKTQIIDLVKQICLTRDNITFKLLIFYYYQQYNNLQGSVLMLLYILESWIHEKQFTVFLLIMMLCDIQLFPLQEMLSVSIHFKIYQKKEKKLQKRFFNMVLQFYFLNLKVDESTDEWGIKITQVFIKDIILSQDLSTVLSAAIKSKKFAESKIISAQSDVEAAKLMKNSSEILNSKSAMQIRYLDSINYVARQSCPKLVFIPFDEKASYE